MDAYDPDWAPRPFALNTTGLICHFNALLQALAAQTSVAKAVLSNEAYFARTETGRALFTFVQLMIKGDGVSAPADQQLMAPTSAKLIAALISDLRRRRPRATFSSGQEPAGEGLTHLLDMLEPPSDEAEPDAAPAIVNGPDGPLALSAAESPLARLFLHRYRRTMYCQACSAAVSTNVDLSTIFTTTTIAGLHRLVHAPSDAAKFSEGIRRFVDHVPDYKCEPCLAKVRRDECSCAHCTQVRVAGAPACTCPHHREGKGAAFCLYQLMMMPEIAVLLFNINVYPRPRRYIPSELIFTATDGEAMRYIQTAAIEQFGRLDSGHYTARALRRGGTAYQFNDAAPPVPTALVATPNVFIAMYHYAGMTPAAPPVVLGPPGGRDRAAADQDGAEPLSQG